MNTNGIHLPVSKSRCAACDALKLGLKQSPSSFLIHNHNHNQNQNQNQWRRGRSSSPTTRNSIDGRNQININNNDIEEENNKLLRREFQKLIDDMKELQQSYQDLSTKNDNLTNQNNHLKQFHEEAEQKLESYIAENARLAKECLKSRKLLHGCQGLAEECDGYKSKLNIEAKEFSVYKQIVEEERNIFASQLQDLKDEVSQLKAQNFALSTEISTLKAKLNGNNNRNIDDNTINSIQNIRKRNSDLENDNQLLRNYVKELTENLKLNNDQVEKQISSVREEFVKSPSPLVVKLTSSTSQNRRNDDDGYGISNNARKQLMQRMAEQQKEDIDISSSTLKNASKRLLQVKSVLNPPFPFTESTSLSSTAASFGNHHNINRSVLPPTLSTASGQKNNQSSINSELAFLNNYRKQLQKKENELLTQHSGNGNSARKSHNSNYVKITPIEFDDDDDDEEVYW